MGLPDRQLIGHARLSIAVADFLGGEQLGGIAAALLAGGRLIVLGMIPVHESRVRRAE
jgi:hypothetical protein